MIKTTYRGRAIKILAARGKPGHVRTFINGKPINHAWQGTDEQAVEWFRQIIDQMDAAGGPGNCAERLPYTEPHWWEPGTFDVNPNGHATRPGSVCLCSRCGTVDKAYAPLKPNTCRYCHLGPDDHQPSALLPYGPHQYTEPTDTQRVGRQAVGEEIQSGCRSSR